MCAVWTTYTSVNFLFFFSFAISQWEVADAVLEVFHKLLRDYEPQPSDFVQEMVELQGEQVPAHKPPGHSIMFHLLNDSPMLGLCLSLLEEGVRQLDTYTPFPGERTYVDALRGRDRECVFVLTPCSVTLLLQVRSSWSRQCCTACACWTWPCRRRWRSWTFSGRARPPCWFPRWSSSSKGSVLKLGGPITLSILPGKCIQASIQRVALTPCLLNLFLFNLSIFPGSFHAFLVPKVEML